MSEATVDITEEVDEAPSEYTSESPASAVVAREVTTAPGSATGRRKEAIARVRLVPERGSGPSMVARSMNTSRTRFTSRRSRNPSSPSVRTDVLMSSLASTEGACRGKLERSAWASRGP